MSFGYFVEFFAPQIMDKVHQIVDVIMVEQITEFWCAQTAGVRIRADRPKNTSVTRKISDFGQTLSAK